MRILCHICCAQCFLGMAEMLDEKDKRLEGFFFNPNIHPLVEFRKRLKSVKVLRDRLKFRLHAVENYGLKSFIAMTAFRDEPQTRCPLCYRQRLFETARFAAENGFDAFTTTLLVSRHQRHEAIAEAGREAAEFAGVDFYYRDFRPNAAKAHDEAARTKLHLQSYCGCIFSERERYAGTTKELYKD